MSINYRMARKGTRRLRKYSRRQRGGQGKGSIYGGATGSTGATGAAGIGVPMSLQATGATGAAGIGGPMSLKATSPQSTQRVTGATGATGATGSTGVASMTPGFIPGVPTPITTTKAATTTAAATTTKAATTSAATKSTSHLSAHFTNLSKLFANIVQQFEALAKASA